MSKEQEHIDKLIKEKISVREFGAPPQAFLDDINARLDAEQKKTIWFYLFTLMGIIVLAGFIALFFIPNQEKRYSMVESSTGVKDRIAKSETKVSQTRNENPQTDWNEKKTGLINSNDSFKKSMETLNIESKTIFNRESKSLNTKSKEVSTVDKKSHNSTLKTKDSLSSKISHFNPLQVKNVKGYKDTVLKNTLDDSVSMHIPNNQQNSLKHSLPRHHAPIMVFAPALPKIKNQLGNSNFFRLDRNTIEKTLYPSVHNSIATQPTFKPYSFEIQLFGGIAIDQSRISNAVTDDYKTQIQAQSRNKISPYLGTNLNLIFKNYVFSSGLTFSQQKEENNYQIITNQYSDSIYISHYEYVFDSTTNPPDSALVPVYDTTQTTTKQYEKVQLHQNYSWLQIPIHFGYRFQFNKWSITPSLGVNISIGLANKSFKYPHQNFEEISAFTPMKWHVNLQGNIEVQRRLNQWHIFARAGYQHGLSPVLKSDTFDRKYNKINTIFGVGYSF
nr:hypothetical protein [uncultured Brumimicrobium sp.]